MHKETDDEIEAAENKLKENCRALNLTFRNETPRNGNCLFEAVSSQLRDLGLRERSAEEMRQEVIDYLMENRNFQGVDGSVNIEHFIDSRFEDWARNMRHNGVFADHVVVVGLAYMLETNMLIVTSNPQSNPDNCMNHIVGRIDYRGTPILLGHVWENHYHSLIHVDDRRQNDRLEEHRKELDEDDAVVSADINIMLAAGTAIREMKIKGKVSSFAPVARTIGIPQSSSNAKLSNTNDDEESEYEGM
ncbi:OTUD3 [Mytilus edulis]|uniref:OTUD3 n=1 Tax=Mytilus edulis TaxID=6550 RepID=A0A8S3S760_MYTED|nr:OTUD3 [Mytilus edulis]